MKMKHLCAALALALVAVTSVHAKTVDIKLTARELNLPIDNKGTMAPVWTFDGQIPGPLVRVTEGDTVNVTLVNDKSNHNSHSIDMHASQEDVLTDFAPVSPGSVGKYTFVATHPGVFFYHCGADPMIQHVARGMFGAILVEPKDPKAMPKADREYVLVQSEQYANPENVPDMMTDKWKHVVFNGKPFRYDPVHDEAAAQMLQAKPGERVRIYFVNAGPNDFSSFHPIAGIWDAVYPSGNPKNVLHGMQSYVVGPGDAATFDIISPKEVSNAIVSHSLRQALTGAIAILQFTKDADPKMGHGDNIIVR